MSLLVEKGFFPQSTPQVASRTLMGLSSDIAWILAVRRTPLPLVSDHHHHHHFRCEILDFVRRAYSERVQPPSRRYEQQSGFREPEMGDLHRPATAVGRASLALAGRLR